MWGQVDSGIATRRPCDVDHLDAPRSARRSFVPFVSWWLTTMARRNWTPLCAVFLLVAYLPISSRADDAPSFSRDVLPILSDKCFKCHGPDEAQRAADLRLDEEASAKRSENGLTIVVEGDSGASELFRRITSSDPAEVMPPADSNLSLTAGEIELIRRWIDSGAEWGGHWAFEPITRPAVPDVSSLDVDVRNPIDAFIIDRLEREGLRPSPEAPRETLVRRVSLDLTGLAAPLPLVDRYLADPDPDAYDRLVERLLVSPAYGERMAWDWLDAARYADSNGYQGDNERTMWPWRDWVVSAFNENMPFDQFTIWQLAGDLLPDATHEQRLATGFCRNHMINGEGGRIPEENRVDYVMDMTETTGTVWLGLTFNCCRCHDHKFDPLSRRDYYSLFAFFNQTPVDGSGRSAQTPPILEAPTDEQAARRIELDELVNTAAGDLESFEQEFFPREEGQPSNQSEAAGELPDALKDVLSKPAVQRSREQLSELAMHYEASAAEYVSLLKALESALGQRDSLAGSIARVMVMADQDERRPTFLLEKGLYNKPEDVEVSMAVPARFSPLTEDAPQNRLGLAEWLVSPENPLTARVTVNRLWQQFFGTGLVKTAGDFGVQGEKPSHPALLDWLAAEFIASGWDVKHICRLIVTSATYRQSSKATPVLIERDPQNRLLARGARFRMPSWMMRDQALAASGLLVDTLGGRPVNPYQPEGVWEETTFGRKTYTQDHGAALYRRSLYTFWRRIIAPTMFFDSASRQVCTVNVSRTNTPLHALNLLNDVTYVEASRALAERVLLSSESDPIARADLAFRLVLARSLMPEEEEVILAAVERLRDDFEADPGQARELLAVGESPVNESLDVIEYATYTALCNAVLNLDEAVTKE
ncbi:MAG: DUF1553 domain-containing protein [Planctomycetota bacterium]|nr:MAG: DUF1553 domain-containing protein [Planctomycetota bacterium]